jgi:wobble nucleotide-excising tRNase
MIESISIAGIATYGPDPAVMSGLKQINFVFGSNGTGKTTIGRILADKAYSSYSTVTWKGGVELQSMVYNRDFVKKNFSASGSVPGVFTLGEDKIAIREQIAAAKRTFNAWNLRRSA